MEMDFEELIDLNERGRCIKCKRREEQMITCERCKEFKYCSVNCLEDNRKNHKTICDLVGLKKGFLTVITDKQTQIVETLKEKARLLNDDGSLKIKELEVNKKQNETGSGLGQDKSKTKMHKKTESMNGHGQNTRRKRNVSSSKVKHEKSVESLIAGGRFGGPTKVTSKEESGKSFGESWWKINPKPVKEEKPKVGSKTTSSEKTETKFKFKDFYDDSEDDEGDKKSDSKLESEEGACSNPNSVVQSDESLTQTEMAMVKYDPKKAKEEMERSSTNQNGPVMGKCIRCQKKGSVLKCSRCKSATYCGKVCQVADYQQHKDYCRLKARFDTALEKVPRMLICALRLMGGPSLISPFLEDILNPFHAMLFNLRSDTAVMVEILARQSHHIFLGAIVRDMRSEVTQVMFFVDTINYKHFTNNLFPPFVPILLPTCIKPGNFILLLAPKWSVLPGGNTGFLVSDLGDVHFVFMED